MQLCSIDELQLTVITVMMPGNCQEHANTIDELQVTVITVMMPGHCQEHANTNEHFLLAVLIGLLFLGSFPYY